jgi:hypothetical protein
MIPVGLKSQKSGTTRSGRTDGLRGRRSRKQKSLPLRPEYAEGENAALGVLCGREKKARFAESVDNLQPSSESRL